MYTDEEKKAIEACLCKDVVLAQRAVADAKSKLDLARKHLQDFRDRDEESRQMKFEFAENNSQLASVRVHIQTSTLELPKGPTCKEFANAMGHDQAKTMGVPFSDEPLSEWQKRNDEWRERKNAQKHQ